MRVSHGLCKRASVTLLHLTYLISPYTYTYIYICVCMCVYIYIYTYTYTCVCVCVCVCIHIRVYIHILYVYIHIYAGSACSGAVHRSVAGAGALRCHLGRAAQAHAPSYTRSPRTAGSTHLHTFLTPFLPPSLSSLSLASLSLIGLYLCVYACGGE
jgi:ABC-type siderophore export system fused ATPase/permease subunit